MRTAREAPKQCREIRRQANNRSEFMQAHHISWPQHDAAARHDNGWFVGIDFFQHDALFLAKFFLPESGENLRNRHAECGRDHLVGIEARPARRLRQPSADRRFAGSHEPDQDDRPICRVHRVICGFRVGFQAAVSTDFPASAWRPRVVSPPRTFPMIGAWWAVLLEWPHRAQVGQL